MFTYLCDRSPGAAQVWLYRSPYADPAYEQQVLHLCVMEPIWRTREEDEHDNPHLLGYPILLPTGPNPSPVPPLSACLGSYFSPDHDVSTTIH